MLLKILTRLHRHIVWRLIAAWLLAFWFGAAWLLSMPARAGELQITAGADLWRVDGGPARYLPDYSLPPGHTFSTASPWLSLRANHTLQTPFGGLTFTGAGMYHTLSGGRIDRLDVDWRATQQLGLRLGVLPYRVSWCRSIDEGPWLLEPDAYCRFHGLREVAQGAFGVQAYTTGIAGGWLLDGMLGAYNPGVDKQDDKLGPFVAVGPTVRHRKHGASINALHLPTGLQLRAGWLRTEQDQASATGTHQRRMRYDMTYLAAEAPATRWLTLRASVNTNNGDQTNPASPFAWQGTSATVEAIARPTAADTLAMGLSEYDNRTLYPAPPNHQRVTVPSWSLAWRHDWPSGWATTVQATHTTDDATTRAGTNTLRTGNALGLRVARVF